MLNTRMIVTRYGGAEVLQALEEPLRNPEKGEVRVKVQSAGVALADIMRREGLYPNSPQPPFTPGYDAVGIVDEAGEDMQGWARGDRVGVFFAGTGGYSAYIYAKENEIFRVPDSVDAAEAAAVILNYVTAYQLLHRLAQVTKGDRILIHGASGGVGSALLELGQLAGVRMFGTASRSKHDMVARFGAIPIDYREEDFVEVLASLAPEGMDAVFDPIGGDNWPRSFRTLGSKGRFIGYGYTSVLGGSEAEDWVRDWKRVAESAKTDTGHPARLYSITSLKKDHPEWFMEDVQILLRMLEQNQIRPVVSHRIPLREAASAQQLLEQSRATGKVVLICP